MKLSQLAAAAVVFLAGSAAEPAFAATDPDVIWQGNFDDGMSSIGGHCNYGENGWCGVQTIRAGQIQVVNPPAFEGHGLAARMEVKYGDVYSTYSDERTLISPSLSMWEDEGNDRWYRWQVMWPDGWVGDYPKWDELTNPNARSSAGSVVEWHHDANGQVETGSAPLYIGANNTDIWLCLVDQATSACRETITLTKLLRGHWHDFVMHAKWSSDPSIGVLEMWIDGNNVLPWHPCSNMYPGMRNYLLVGLYRNGHIGDPSLIWPAGTPLAGQPVYGTDGTPGVVYVDGFIAGKTRVSVDPPVPVDPPPASDGGTFTPAPTTPTPIPVARSSFMGAGGGCATSGRQGAWLALPLIGLVALRRRRRAG
jgi:hypothetical protein